MAERLYKYPASEKMLVCSSVEFHQLHLPPDDLGVARVTLPVSPLLQPSIR